MLQQMYLQRTLGCGGLPMESMESLHVTDLLQRTVVYGHWNDTQFNVCMCKEQLRMITTVRLVATCQLMFQMEATGLNENKLAPGIELQGAYRSGMMPQRHRR